MEDNPEVLKIGDVEAVSRKYNVKQLGKILKDLLKDKNIQKLLSISKAKKLNGGFSYD